MTEKEFNKLDKQTQLSMLREIDKNYQELDLPIIEPNYDNNGEIKNKKEVDSSLKKCLTILFALWTINWAITETNSKKSMVIVNNRINTLKRSKNATKTIITTKEWNNIIDKAVKDRIKKVKIKQVIKGNAKRLNKQVQKTVVNGYKNGKRWTQISKELQKEFGYNKNKAKSIAITERNYYKSEAQLQAISNAKGIIKKIWVHNSIGIARDEHIAADGQVADKDGYFYVAGQKVQGPQHFGDPSQDINCHCTVRLE